MADFDDNPFADPGAINPFADPAVTEATTTPKDATEEYNPFTEEAKAEPPRLPPPPTKTQVKSKEKKEKAKPKSRPAAPERPKETEPAIMRPDDPPPAYNPAPPAFSDPHDEEMRKKEAEISQREQALQERERNLERLGGTERPNNFPPFPKFCPYPLKPCFYLNVKVEVPPREQWKVYYTLALLVYLWVLLLVNMLVAIIGAISTKVDRGVYLTTMGVSILYFVLFLPGSLFCWFLPLYHAYKRDSSLSFMWFFFIMLFQILSFVLNGIGIPNLGACGFFNGATFFNGSGKDTPGNGEIAAGVMFIIMGFFWFLGAVLCTVVLIMIHKYYRASGHTINQAVEEGVSGAASNKHVRSAVKSGVSTGVKTAFNSSS